MQLKALVVLAEGFEEIEAVTPIDLLRRANIMVAIAGLTSLTVRGARGISIKADLLLADCNTQSYDALVLPGGMPGANNLKASDYLRQIIQTFDASGKILAAICAAPTVLSAAGVLQNRRVTSFPDFQQEIICREYSTESVVWDDTIITSRGAGTSIPFALAIITALTNAETAQKIAAAIQFPG